MSVWFWVLSIAGTYLIGILVAACLFAYTNTEAACEWHNCPKHKYREVYAFKDAMVAHDQWAAWIFWPVSLFFLIIGFFTFLPEWFYNRKKHPPPPRPKKVRYKCAECRKKMEEPTAAVMGKEERFRA